VAVRGVSEIMVGLNDLHRTLGLKSHFEVLASDLLMAISGQIRDAGLRFGLGGVARPGDNSLPVPADLVLAQFPRLGATSAWIARSFFKEIELAQFAAETVRLRRAIDHWFVQPKEVLAEKHMQLRQLATSMREDVAHDRVA